ncbi:bifunctional 3,4-dihydroxy-2-butanone-4-phosphate synthase/GTP cyclohydrolase II [soil metagenome]
MPIVSIPEAIETYRQGKFVIIVDDEDRENEGDLVIAGEAITPEAVTFMARKASGLICVPMAGEYLDRLGLGMMVPPARNGTRFGTAFTVSVESTENVSTGISAADRAQTISVLADPESGPADLVQPGHIFPLRYHPGGVLARAGQTEASFDLALLAGMFPVAVVCEIMEDDGTMARMPSLECFSEEFDIPIVTIADLIEFRQTHELPQPGLGATNGAHPVIHAKPSVERMSDVRLPSTYGGLRLYAYREVDAPEGAQPHIALVAGDLSGPEPVLTRIHSECLTGDVFGSQRCDCGQQLDGALEQITREGRGVVLYLRQEGRGIGLLNKLRAYELQDEGFDTVEANHQLGFPADTRDYRTAADMLLDLGVHQVRLLTNNPAKISGLKEYGVDVLDRLPLIFEPNEANRRYLETKREKMGHLIA